MTDLALRWAIQPARPRRRIGQGDCESFANLPSITRPGPPHRDSAAALTALSLRAQAPYFYRDEQITALMRRLHAYLANRAAGSDLHDLVRPVGCHRYAHQRTDRIGPCRCGSEQGSLSIRGGKFGKSRLAAAASDHHCRLPLCRAPRRPLSRTTDSELFSLRAGNTADGVECTPHLRQLVSSDCLRLRTIITAHGSMICAIASHPDPARLVPLRRERRAAPAAVAAYLGHAHVSDTYWYLSATPELLALAARAARTGPRREVQP